MRNVHESAEDYLETILLMEKKMPVIRSVDIANETGYKKSSISVAMKNLRNNGHIVVSDEGYISLTESGREIAETVYERHEFFTEFLTQQGVDPEIASEDACRIEHVISKDSFSAIKKFINTHR